MTKRHIIPLIGFGFVTMMSFVLIVVVVVRPWGGHDTGWATHLNLTDEPLENYSRSVETLVDADGTASMEIWQRSRCDGESKNGATLVSFDLEPCGDDPIEEWVAHGCAGCHGLDGTGSVVGPTAIELIGEDFAKTVRFGPAGMPAFTEADLSDAHIQIIADYLTVVRAEVYPNGIPPTPMPTVAPTPTPQPTATPTPTVSAGSPVTATATAVVSAGPESDELFELGREVYNVTAGGDGCQYCHGLDGLGGGKEGESAPSIVGADRGSVREALRGAFDMSDIKLTNDELAAVVVYLQYLATEP